MRSRKEREHQKRRVRSCVPGDRPAEDLELSSVTEQQLQNQRECGWPAVEHTWDCPPVLMHVGQELGCSSPGRVHYFANTNEVV